jgi:hypothetical protein
MVLNRLAAVAMYFSLLAGVAYADMITTRVEEEEKPVPEIVEDEPNLPADDYPTYTVEEIQGFQGRDEPVVDVAGWVDKNLDLEQDLVREYVSEPDRIPTIDSAIEEMDGLLPQHQWYITSVHDVSDINSAQGMDKFVLEKQLENNGDYGEHFALRVLEDVGARVGKRQINQFYADSGSGNGGKPIRASANEEGEEDIFGYSVGLSGVTLTAQFDMFGTDVEVTNKSRPRLDGVENRTDVDVGDFRFDFKVGTDGDWEGSGSVRPFDGKLLDKVEFFGSAGSDGDYHGVRISWDL